jgi:drug/metabolite transporter (DMT)-like permease
VPAAVLALLGAVLIGCGAAQQHAGAAGTDEHAPLDPRLLVHLARRKAWLLGMAMNLGGFALIATAIATGRLAVVEPIGATQVLFALLFAARATRSRLRRAEWLAAAATIVGLAGFLLVASPEEGDAAELVPWAVPIGVLAAVVAVGGLAARAMPPHRRGIVFAVLAGLGFGTADGLIKAISDLGASEVLSHWPLYAWMAVSPAAFLLQQSAYHATRLAAAMPATSTLAPTTATLLGAAMFGEELRGGWAVPAELAFFALLLAGVAALARSETLEAEPAD